MIMYEADIKLAIPYDGPEPDEEQKVRIQDKLSGYVADLIEAEVSGTTVNRDGIVIEGP